MHKSVIGTESSWQHPRNTEAGFTLFESLILVVIVAILAALGIPTFSRLLLGQRLSSAQHEIYQGLRSTQTQAMQEKRDWRFSIRDRDGQLEWASHVDAVTATQVPVWHALNSNLAFDQIDTTLRKSGGVYYARFNFRGDVSGQLGRVTLMGKSGGHDRRCVVVSTLIGGMRRGEDHTRADDNGRYCY